MLVFFGQKLIRAAKPLFWAGTFLSVLVSILLLVASFDRQSGALLIVSVIILAAGPALSMAAAAVIYFLGEHLRQ